jgi:hypothetical protein
MIPVASGRGGQFFGCWVKIIDKLGSALEIVRDRPSNAGKQDFDVWRALKVERPVQR